MKLAVPLYLQDPGSKDCGLAGIQMILAYYQDSVSLAELKETLDVDQTGTYAPQLGTYLLHRGYTVEIVSLHPKLFTTHDAGMNTPEILTRFRNLKETEKNEQNKKVLDYFIEFLGNGGTMNVKIPRLEDISEEIHAGRPLGALLTTRFLASKEPKFNFHFNVITGIEKNRVYVNDSWPEEFGGSQSYDADDFMYGIHASAYGDLDNACLMKIRKAV